MNTNGIDIVPKIWKKFQNYQQLTPYSIDDTNNMPLIDYVVK